jgi:hypothetical protein
MIDQIMNSEDAGLCISILAVALTVYRPVTLDELAVFVNMPNGVSSDDEALSDIIGLCGSFLTLRERTVLFVHQSAKDYLITNKEAQSAIFPSGITDVHHSIFSRSLQAMNAPGILKQNIYALPHPGTMTDELTTPEPDSLAPVRYSCVYWIDHLLDCGPTSNTINDLQEGGSVHQFLRQRYLYWLEALGWAGKISDGIHSITALESFVSVSTCPA